MARTRKIRSDCNYIIYEMVDERGQNYVGLTRKALPNADRVVAERWRKHRSRARCEHRLWALYVYLKTGGLELNWTHRVIAVIRGRAEAYAWEREYVKQHRPSLNDQYL